LKKIPCKPRRFPIISVRDADNPEKRATPRDRSRAGTRGTQIREMRSIAKRRKSNVPFRHLLITPPPTKKPLSTKNTTTHSRPALVPAKKSLIRVVLSAFARLPHSTQLYPREWQITTMNAAMNLIQSSQ
jgi:hypothetical protein